MSRIRAENLFRKHAIDSLTEGRTGRPICLVPRAWRWLTVLVAILFSATAFFLCNAEYARKENVRGWLVSESGVVQIASNAPGIVSRVALQAGDKVSKGEPLIFVSTDETMSNGTAVSTELLTQLQLEHSEIDTQLSLSQKQRELAAASLAEQLREMDIEIDALGAARDVQRQRILRGAEKLQRIHQIANEGAASDWDLIQQQDESGLLRLEMDTFAQNLARLQREREALKAQLDDLPLRTRMQQSALRARQSQLSQKIAEQEIHRSSVLISPRDGYVASVDAHVGATVRPGQTLMTLLPEQNDLAAELYVPSRAAGFVRAGQQVRISYDAFPQQKFGTFAGRVRRVSDYVFLPSEIPQTFPIREATYRVHVAVDSHKIKTSVGPAALRPGMLLAAEIVLEERNLLDWLLEPLGMRRSKEE